MPLVLFNLLIGPYQLLPRRARVDLGVMAMEGCSAFPKAPALLESYYQIVLCLIQDIHWEGSTPPADWARNIWDYIAIRLNVLRNKYTKIKMQIYNEHNSLIFTNKIPPDWLTCRYHSINHLFNTFFLFLFLPLLILSLQLYFFFSDLFHNIYIYIYIYIYIRVVSFLYWYIKILVLFNPKSILVGFMINLLLVEIIEFIVYLYIYIYIYGQSMNLIIPTSN